MEKAQNLPTELMAHVLRMTQYSKCIFFKKNHVPYVLWFWMVHFHSFVFVMWTVFCAELLI